MTETERYNLLKARWPHPRTTAAGAELLASASGDEREVLLPEYVRVAGLESLRAAPRTLVPIRERLRVSPGDLATLRRRPALSDSDGLYNGCRVVEDPDAKIPSVYYPDAADEADLIEEMERRQLVTNALTPCPYCGQKHRVSPTKCASTMMVGPNPSATEGPIREPYVAQMNRENPDGTFRVASRTLVEITTAGERRTPLPTTGYALCEQCGSTESRDGEILHFENCRRWYPQFRHILVGA